MVMHMPCSKRFPFIHSFSESAFRGQGLGPEAERRREARPPPARLPLHPPPAGPWCCSQGALPKQGRGRGPPFVSGSAAQQPPEHGAEGTRTARREGPLRPQAWPRGLAVAGGPQRLLGQVPVVVGGGVAVAACGGAGEGRPAQHCGSEGRSGLGGASVESVGMPRGHWR